MKRPGRKTWLLIVLVLLAAVAAVGGYAYWTSTGTGTGSASVGTSTAWTVATDAATGGPMTPGGGAPTYESVKYRVTNGSTGRQALANVNIKVANTDGTAWSSQSDTGKPACAASDFQLSVNGGTSWAAAGAAVDDTALAGNLAAGATTADGTITIRMVDTGANQDNCKSLTVPLYLSAS